MQILCTPKLQLIVKSTLGLGDFSAFKVPTTQAYKLVSHLQNPHKFQLTQEVRGSLELVRLDLLANPRFS